MNAYDFDETIYDGESSVEVVFAFIKHDPSVLKFIPKVMKEFVRYNKGKLTVEEFKSKYADELRMYFEKHKDAIPSIVCEFWDKRMDKIKPFYKDVQKDDDIIITASPYFMMEEICKRLGIKNLVASEVDLDKGEIVRACFREGKIDCLNDAFPDVEIDDFYTDSMNDQFLFPFAKRVFMVKGNKITQIK